MHPFIVHQINHLPPDIRRPFIFTRSLNKTGLQRIPECGYPMSRRIPRLTGARPTNEQTRLMNFTPYLADVAGRGVLISFRSAYGSLRPHPRFCFTSGHLSVCDRTDPVWSAQRLAGTVPLRLVGRNGVGKTRLLRLLAGLDSPAGGHIERAAAVAR